jgi:flagellar motor switch protein FliN
MSEQQQTDGEVAGNSATIAPSDASATRPSAGNLDLVLDVELPLVVRFGRTVMSLRALSGLGPGSIVDMGRSPDDPVELLVSDKVIAYGEVVIVEGSYGLRITDLVNSPDRLRALES